MNDGRRSSIAYRLRMACGCSVRCPERVLSAQSFLPLRATRATPLGRTRKSVNGRWCGLNLAIASCGLPFVMRVRAAQEGQLVQHVLLEPFKPKIDNWRNEQRNQLRENQTTNDHQAE